MGDSANSPAVEACISALKGERERYGVKADVLPILRFNPASSRHSSFLHSLGLSQKDHLQVLLCGRGADGWPDSLGGLFSGEAAARDAFREAVGLPPATKEEPASPVRRSTPAPLGDRENLTEVGLLLVYRRSDSEERKRVDSFLTELGRYWAERYGRVKPPPYPLGHYDLTDIETESRVYRAFPELENRVKPLVCLCLFDRNRPKQVLETFDDLDLPATLVRQISSLRAGHLAATVELKPKSDLSLPNVNEVQFTEYTEEKLAQSRIHEIARQLWAEASDGPRGENRVTRRVLFTITELTKPGRERSPEQQERLLDAFEDLRAEPLILSPESDLRQLQTQLLQAAQAILQEE